MTSDCYEEIPWSDTQPGDIVDLRSMGMPGPSLVLSASEAVTLDGKISTHPGRDTKAIRLRQHPDAQPTWNTIYEALEKRLLDAQEQLRRASHCHAQASKALRLASTGRK